MGLPKLRWRQGVLSLWIVAGILATSPNRAQEEQQERFVSREEMGRYVVPIRSFLDVHAGVPDENEPDNVEDLVIQLEQYTERLQSIYDRSLKPGEVRYPPLNWLAVLDMSGGQVHRTRERVGLDTFAEAVGVTPGQCDTVHGEFWIQREREQIQQVAREFDMDPALLMAVLRQESGGNPRCISTTGAMGPAGLTYYLYTSRVWSDGELRAAINPFHYPAAVRRSAEYLRFLYDNFQDWRLALAGYYDGESGITQVIRQMDAAGEAAIAETVMQRLQSPQASAYAEAVLKRREALAANLMPPSEG